MPPASLLILIWLWLHCLFHILYTWFLECFLMIKNNFLSCIGFPQWDRRDVNCFQTHGGGERGNLFIVEFSSTDMTQCTSSPHWARMVRMAQRGAPPPQKCFPLGNWSAFFTSTDATQVQYQYLQRKKGVQNNNLCICKTQLSIRRRSKNGSP